MNGETGAIYRHSYSESNGEAIGKGYYLSHGWDNDGLWEVTFEFKHDNIQYTGITYIAQLHDSYDENNSYATWEGSFPGTTKYASYTSGSVGYFDITVTKIDETHIRVKSETLNKDSGIYEVPNMANWEKVTIGARHHGSSSSYGPCRIRNVKVIKL